MKKIFLQILFISLFAANAHAKFYVNPFLSAGYGNSNYFSETRGLLAYNIGANIGYQLSKIRLETGLSYYSNAYKYEDPYTLTGTVTDRSSRVMLPLKFGYSINLGNKISIVPFAGIGLSPNNNIRHKLVASYLSEPRKSGYNVKKLHAVAIIEARAEIEVTNKITTTIGASFLKTTGLINKRYNDLTHSVLFNAGVKYMF